MAGAYGNSEVATTGREIYVLAKKRKQEDLDRENGDTKRLMENMPSDAVTKDDEEQRR